MGILRRYAAILITLGACSSSAGAVKNTTPSLLPRPAYAHWTGARLALAATGAPVTACLPAEATGPVAEGARLLASRLRVLGSELAAAGPKAARVIGGRATRNEAVEWLARAGVEATVEPRRLRQAYRLTIAEVGDGTAAVRLEAGEPLGLFYGLVTLAQLIERETTRGLVVPEGEVVDHPAVAVRLAKISASQHSPPFVHAYARWQPLFKMSHLGLQYHGSNSKEPEPPFLDNVQLFCPMLRESGVLDSIVYFCPFRGQATSGRGAYDFSRPGDRQAYASFVRWVMAQGAHGIEVDYNDWPGSPEVPIADVIDLACEAVADVDPDAIVLYCPPLLGEQSYRGMASEALRETLSRVPAHVWPLWTGMETLMQEPLDAGQIEQWTRIAGRKPFLWVNRAGPRVREAFAVRAPGAPEGLVFNGGVLPPGLPRLVMGVHLNVGFRDSEVKDGGPHFDRETLVYLATAADYLWNPAAWEPAESLCRARRFVDMWADAVAPPRR